MGEAACPSWQQVPNPKLGKRSWERGWWTVGVARGHMILDWLDFYKGSLKSSQSNQPFRIPLLYDSLK